MSINLQEIINKLQTAKSELQQQGRFSQYAEGLDGAIDAHGHGFLFYR